MSRETHYARAQADYDAQYDRTGDDEAPASFAARAAAAAFQSWCDEQRQRWMNSRNECWAKFKDATREEQQ